jgi:hypothetical protein
MLRSKTVSYVDSHASECGPAPTQCDLIVAIPEAEAAAMEENQSWTAFRRRNRRTMDPHCDGGIVTRGDLLVGFCISDA